MMAENFPHPPARRVHRGAWFLVFATAVVVFWLLIRPHEPVFLNKPTLLVSLPQGRGVAVYDSGNYRVLLYNHRLEPLGVIRHPWLEKVWGMDANASGEIILANERYQDPGRDSKDTWIDILVFDREGKLRASHTLASGTRSVEMPGQVRAEPDASFLVTDLKGNRVVRVRSDGTVVPCLQEAPPEEGGLYYPNDILRLPDGRILLVESYHSRLRLFAQDFTPLETLAGRGTAEGQLSFPQFLARDQDGQIYLTELATMRVSIFGPDLRFRTLITPRTAGVEGFPLQLFGVAILEDPRRIVIADSLHNRLLVFSAGGRFLREIDYFSRVEPPR